MTATPVKMDPIFAINNLADIENDLRRLVGNINLECNELANNWEGIGNIGGQREDHAATLLTRLKPHLSGLAEFCRTVEAQIDQMHADPFGRNES
jgi:hypothetical protein